MAATIADGTYRVVSALDPGVNFDVAGGSGAQGANLQLWGATDSSNNTQLFRVENLANGNVAIRSAFTGFAIDAGREGGAVVGGANVSLWPWDTTIHQQWEPVRAGAVDVNGESVPAYLLKSAAVPTLCADAAGGKAYAGSNVWLWPVEGSTGWAGQWWAFVPESPCDPGIPAPSAVSAVGGPSLAPGTRVVPRWAGVGGGYQCRYRTRSRRSASADASRTAWGRWASLSGSHACDGWGDALAAAGTAAAEGGFATADRSVSVPIPQGSDLAEVEIEVRGFADGSHGPSASGVVRIAAAPSATVSGAAWTPEGLVLDVSVTGRTPSLVLSGSVGGAVLFDGFRTAATGSVTIPQSALSGIPQAGATLDVAWSASTADGVHAAGRASVKVSRTAGTLDASPTSEVADGSAESLHLAFAGRPGLRVWLVSGGAMAELDAGGGAVDVLYPLGRPFEVYATVRSGDAFGVWSKAYGPRGSNLAMLNFGGGFVRVAHGLGGRPEIERSVGRAVDSLAYAGRPWSAASAAPCAGRSWSLSFALTDRADEWGWRAALAALEQARYATFRDPDGGSFPVAVESVRVAGFPGGAEVAVALKGDA